MPWQLRSFAREKPNLAIFLGYGSSLLANSCSSTLQQDFDFSLGMGCCCKLWWILARFEVGLKFVYFTAIIPKRNVNMEPVVCYELS